MAKTTAEKIDEALQRAIPLERLDKVPGPPLYLPKRRFVQVSPDLPLYQTSEQLRSRQSRRRHVPESDRS
jgi:hypothetical protein